MSDLTTGAHEIIACVKELRAENAALTAERDALREIIAGRTTAPTDAEIEAHCRGGGAWLAFGPGGERDLNQEVQWTKSLRDESARLGIQIRWWRMSATGEGPCAWPVVTEVTT